jgi:diguanylate cyclase (GGDEF)-like protein
MNNLRLQNGKKMRSLMSVLRRAHLNIVFIVTTMIGLSLTVIGAVVLMTYTNNNLRLIAHAVSYDAEAATVFEDRSAAFDALQSMASTEDVSSGSITDSEGNVLAQWVKPTCGIFCRISIISVRLLHEKSVVMPIVHNGVTIGEVTLSSGGQSFLRYILAGLACIFFSQALIVILSFYLSRRMLNSIVLPLQNLSKVAHSVGQDRDFVQRVPPAEIEELNSLAEDFNALLEELAQWQSRIKTERESLEHKASHDGLTGLSNRVLFEDRLIKAIAEADRLRGNLAVLLLDCDGFKRVNDEFGHAAGDAVLIEISKRIKSQVRANDLAVRLGGDEFVLLINPLIQSADVQRIVGDIERRMQAPIELPGGENVVLSLSIGVAMYPEQAVDVETLLREADLAMYRAKFATRNGREKDSSPGNYSINARLKEQ